MKVKHIVLKDYSGPREGSCRTGKRGGSCPRSTNQNDVVTFDGIQNLLAEMKPNLKRMLAHALEEAGITYGELEGFNGFSNEVPPILDSEWNYPGSRGFPIGQLYDPDTKKIHINPSDLFGQAGRYPPAIAHEVGHYVSSKMKEKESTYEKLVPLLFGFTKASSDIESLKKIGFGKWADHASSSPEEFIAETFAIYKTGSAELKDALAQYCGVSSLEDVFKIK